MSEKPGIGTIHPATPGNGTIESFAPVMFWLSQLFLLLLAVLLVAWVDVPRVTANTIQTAPGDAEMDEDELPASRVSDWERGAFRLGEVAAWGLVGIWPIFVIESLATIFVYWRCGDPKGWKALRLFVCLFPPARLCPAAPGRGGQKWLPPLGWFHPDERIRRAIEDRLNAPMIVAALVILPVLIVEWTMQRQIAENVWLRLLLHIGTGFIWYAFAFEYLLMISLAKRKWLYFKSHLIDFIIIVLPLLSFLRSLQVLRATRIAKVARLSQLSRMLRVYRLRGLSMRILRALLVWEVIHRVIGRSPEKRRKSLLDQIQLKEEEIVELRRQLSEIDVEIEKRRKRK